MRQTGGLLEFGDDRAVVLVYVSISITVSRSLSYKKLWIDRSGTVVHF